MGAVFFIKIFFETPPLKEKLTALALAWLTKDLVLIKTLFWDLLKFIFSGLCSTIVLVHLQKDQSASMKRYSTFLPHTLFFILSLIENLVLVTLPYMAPHLYPEVDCFTTDSRSTALWIVVALWFVGMIAQIIHYKIAHDLGPLNGPQVSESKLELYFTVPWSRKNRRFRASQQGFKCEKIHRNIENAR